MDLVSFETQQEYDWVKGFIDGGVKFFWTSGRKSKLTHYNSAVHIKLVFFSSVQIELVFPKGATSTGATSRSSSPN